MATAGASLPCICTSFDDPRFVFFCHSSAAAAAAALRLSIRKSWPTNSYSRSQLKEGSFVQFGSPFISNRKGCGCYVVPKRTSIRSASIRQDNKTEDEVSYSVAVPVTPSSMCYVRPLQSTSDSLLFYLYPSNLLTVPFRSFSHFSVQHKQQQQARLICICAHHPSS